ncbi:hypothetical protein ACMZOO_15680 [Catenovulum sp. SX2]|uniref:hypothetical protein n=1 Tax=Catenovulum sp. SX2 TaxID=3398614 RepID=UPI003F85FF48
MKITQLITCLAFMFAANAAQAYQSLYETGFYQYAKRFEFTDFERLEARENQGKTNKLWRKLVAHRPMFAAYSPQYPLWTDGAKKRRWIYLPRGKKIDTSNPDQWVFPIGTKLWKEFSFDEENGINRKIETRLLEKLPSGEWLMETYVWNESQTAAHLAPDEGIKDFYALGSGKFYDIPSKHDCEYCHSKAGIANGPLSTPVLGFSALQLSDDRDQNAIHGEALTASMLTLSRLQKLAKVTDELDYLPAIPESEKFPLQRPVFGYLHANCGHCHNQTGLAEFTNTTNFRHKATAKFIQQNGTYATAIAKPISQYLQPQGSPDLLIHPGQPEQSAILYRMTEEHEAYTFEIPEWHHSAGFSLTVGVKMPFVGTNVIDDEAVKQITQYINSLDQSE